MIGQQKNYRILYHQNYHLIEKSVITFKNPLSISKLAWNFLKKTNAPVLLFFSFFFARAPDIFLREGNGNPLQYSFLENPMDRGACRAAVHRVAKESDTTERLTHTPDIYPMSSYV